MERWWVGALEKKLLEGKVGVLKKTFWLQKGVYSRGALFL